VAIRLEVECHAGWRGEQTPRVLTLQGRRVPVEVIDQWLAPDHRYFKLLGEDGCRYIIRHDVATGDWELHSYEADPSTR
jgi:hypothetical protein